ncbi:cystathionine gamma-synthase [Macrolepiota fuliginosa MF-IS2]|uniref:Cystathionine gamma-synthase n=1 Tax=Macrolepiota fuliginosa MF-IS2 TaxID=1400762 RepID=A0A9P5XL68_9AGAR|nr:cystathionine gamma-synthase [Macrolepiota fuliginosa MF-IS2]
MATKKGGQLSGTDLIHGDSGVPYFKGAGGAVAPSISVSTTFRNPHPEENVKPYAQVDLRNPERHMYSRYTQEASSRAEHVLSKILNGYALTYASGLNSVFAALLHYQPKRIAIRGGYHGCYASIAIYQRSQPTVEIIDLDAEYKPGDFCMLETPVNPYGEARDIQYYADKIHKVGGKLMVDSTFAPPPLQDPFQFGADCVMHSGTKYFGGHSDLLCGVLVVKTVEEWRQLHHDRIFIGCSMGSLEAWLLLRSLKTLHLRVPRQSETASALAKWLQSVSKTSKGQTFEGIPGGIVTRVWHSSLQGTDARGFNPRNQMPGGFNPTFSIEFASTELASRLPHSLKYFVPATSLGGVESLVEHRLGSDPGANPSIVRLSIGVEELEDLKADLRQGLQKIGRIQAKL